MADAKRRHDRKAYLSAVYPMARPPNRAAVKAFFEHSLDYFYATNRAPRLQPPVIAPRIVAPYLPSGEYYALLKPPPRPRRWIAPASTSRWPSPTVVVPQPLNHTEFFFSSQGARLGPAPSWTNPLAIVKYPLSPHLEPPPRGALPWLRNYVSRGYVEIEQFGGPLWVTECPGGVCGLWANVWRGTGTFLSLRPDLVLITQSKATAIIDMSRRLDEHALRAVFPADITRDTTVVNATTALFARDPPPCDAVDRFVEDGHAARWRRWVDSRPNAVNDLPRDLYWLLGVCGLGTRGRRNFFAGFDGLITVLSCLLGLETIIFEAAPNDNGLFHQELVDFDFPGSWPKGRRNSLDRCLPPVSAAFPLPTVRALLDHWTARRKFVLLDPFDHHPEPNVSACHLPPAPYWTEPGFDPRFPTASRRDACKVDRSRQSRRRESPTPRLLPLVPGRCLQCPRGRRRHPPLLPPLISSLSRDRQRRCRGWLRDCQQVSHEQQRGSNTAGNSWQKEVL